LALTTGSAHAQDTACDPQPTGTPPRIMIAGDSLTAGTSGEYTWRYRLWEALTRAGGSVDFVGQFTDLIDPVTLAYHQYSYADCAFDEDHESRPGARLLDYAAPAPINDGVPPYYPGPASWVEAATSASEPDVLLLYVGINDLLRIGGVDDPVPAGTT